VLSGLESVVNGQTKALNAQDQSLQQVSQVAAGCQEQLEQTKEQLQAVTITATDTESALAALQSRFEEVTGLHAQTIKEVEQDVKDCSDRMKGVDEEIAELYNLVGTKAEKSLCSDIAQDMQALKDAVRGAENEVNKLSNVHLQGVSGSSKPVDATQLKELHTKVQSLASAVSKLEADASHASAQADVESVVEDLKRVQEDVEMGKGRGVSRDEQLAAMTKQLTALQSTSGNGQLDASSFADRPYVDALVDGVLDKLDAMRKAIAKDQRKELKHFETDLIAFIDDAVGSGSKPGEASAGRVHFRCISCDQPNVSMPGPRSANFRPGSPVVTGVGVHIGPAVKDKREVLASMTVTKGDETEVFGADGRVYRGRDNTQTTFSAAPSPAKGKPSKFTISYREPNPYQPLARSRGSRPQSAPPKRITSRIPQTSLVPTNSMQLSSMHASASTPSLNPLHSPRDIVHNSHPENP